MNELIAGVRIHDDSAARAEADSLGAAAFTRGGEIYLGSEAPSLDSRKGQELLAHEMTHVMQQRAAGLRDDGRVSFGGDAFEQAANGLGPQPAGVPPGTQRQFADPKLAYGPQIVKAIREFLKHILAEQGGEVLRIDDSVKTPLLKLALAPKPNTKGQDLSVMNRYTELSSYLNSNLVNGKPDQLAEEVAKRLPNPMDPAVLAELSVPISKGPAPSGVGALPDLIEKTTPSPEALERTRGDKRMFGKDEKDLRAESTALGEQVIAPPVSQIFDVFSGLTAAKKKGRSPVPVRPRRRTPTTSDIPLQPKQELPSGGEGLMLRDAEFRLKQTLQGEQKGRKSVDLRFSARNEQLSGQEKEQVLSNVTRAIAILLWEQPELTANLGEVNVYFGEHLVRTIPAAGGPASPKEKK